MQTKRNRLFAYLLAAVMMLSVFPVSGFTAFADETAAEQALWEGNGTEEKPYVLKTSEDLKLFMKVNRYMMCFKEFAEKIKYIWKHRGRRCIIVLI